MVTQWAQLNMVITAAGAVLHCRLSTTTPSQHAISRSTIKVLPRPFVPEPAMAGSALVDPAWPPDPECPQTALPITGGLGLPPASAPAGSLRVNHTHAAKSVSFT